MDLAFAGASGSFNFKTHNNAVQGNTFGCHDLSSEHSYD